EIAPARKEVLLKGLDDIGTTMQHAAAIDAYEKTHAATATMYEPVDVKYYSNGREIVVSASAAFPRLEPAYNSIEILQPANCGFSVTTFRVQGGRSCLFNTEVTEKKSSPTASGQASDTEEKNHPTPCVQRWGLAIRGRRGRGVRR